MHNRPAVLVLLACALGGPAAKEGRADKTSDARTAIQAAYDDQNSGYARQDVRAVLSHTAPGYSATGGGRVVPGPMIARGLSQLFAAVSGYHGRIERATSIERIAVNGTQAVVLTAVRIRMSGVDARTGRAATREGGGTTRDVWLKTKTGWLQKSYTRLSGGA